MNYTELQQAILDDTHKSQYVGAPVQRFIAQGEALIASQLESYNFLTTLTDANRIVPAEGRYGMLRLIQLRYVKIGGLPLDKVDETSAYLQRSNTRSIVYVQRASEILIAGVPGVGTTIDVDYMGLPEALSISPTNQLLDKVPQLYIDAASHYVFKRARDYDSAEIALQGVVSMCRQLNAQIKKLLGGANAAGAYNVNFRSAY